MNNDLISRASLLKGIAELKESPWYTDGKDKNNFITAVEAIAYTARKETVEIIENMCIKQEPAVTIGIDLEETHGKWELIGVNRFVDKKTLRCTYCKNYFTVHNDTLNAGRGDANFCPNCGARMDLKDGDSE